MKSERTFLDDLEIASPCSANWDEMSGSERARFCSLCSKHVYNLSELSKQEAEALIFDQEGEVCIRLFRRKDGTVITSNCPVGLRILKDGYKRLAAWVTMAIGGFASMVPCFGDQLSDDKTVPTPVTLSTSMAMGGPAPFRLQLQRKVREAWTLPLCKYPLNLTIELTLYKDKRTPECIILESSGKRKIDASAVSAAISAGKNMELPTWYKGVSIPFRLELLCPADSRQSGSQQQTIVVPGDCTEVPLKQDDKQGAQPESTKQDSSTPEHQ